VAVLVLAALAPATPILRQALAHDGSIGGQSVPLSTPVILPAHRDVPSHSLQLVFSPTAVYLISGLYLAVLLFFSFRLCRLIWCSAGLVRNAQPAPIDPEYDAMWKRAKERFGVHTASLLAASGISGPVTASLWRPVLLLPVSFIQQHSPTEFLAAIGHECAHIERGDFWKNIFYEAVALLTAFHPLTWFIKSQIAQTRELICDRAAAEQLLDRRTYGSSLLQLAMKMPRAAPAAAFHAVGMFDTNILERRIMTLMTSLPTLSKVRRYSLAAGATLLLLICAGAIGLWAQSVAQQNQSTGKEQKANPDMSCTYYDHGVGSEGTCGYDPQDRKKYSCYSNLDSSKSQTQIGCEWKVKRAEAAQR
jgi:beta-lactamase regulating signal transducer with metallopeptidase domain